MSGYIALSCLSPRHKPWSVSEQVSDERFAPLETSEKKRVTCNVLHSTINMAKIIPNGSMKQKQMKIIDGVLAHW